jgi:FkbM family methyltransferase
LRSAYASGSFLLRFYLKALWKPKSGSLEFELYQLAKQNSHEFQFIQVGANDGLINDPLLRLIALFQWQGILLEPQPLVFERELKPLYQNNQRIHLVNAAVDRVEGNRTLYTISFSTQRWATGLASFSKPTLESRINDGYVEKAAIKYGDILPANKMDWMSSTDIACRSFESLIMESSMKSLDLLQIDTEGYDFEIIRMFPFHLIQPRAISFENEHSSDDAYAEILLFLQEKGYRVKEIGRDSLALKA